MLVAYLTPYVDEIVIVDTGSDIVDIGRMMRWPKVSLVPAVFENFADTRNIGLATHKYEWTLGLDPDELPSFDMLAHIRYVTGRDGKGDWPTARAWCYWTYNWWEGTLGPEEPYHWHTRLWKTKGSYLERPVHELVVVQGEHEATIRNTKKLLKAPKEAFLIHSKNAADIEQADLLYEALGEVSR